MTSGEIVFDMYLRTAQLICPLDKDIIIHNTCQVTDMMKKDREIIPLEPLMFIAHNLGHMVIMLGIDYKNTRDVFGDFLDEEISLDDIPSYKKIEFRNKTADSTIMNSKNKIIFGKSDFSNIVYKKLMDECENSFNAISESKYMNSFGRTVARMQDDDKMILSVIMSNYMYLLRLFTHNAVFLNEIANLISNFKSEYGLR